MIDLQTRPYLVVVWTACLVHAVWAALLLVPGYNAKKATPVAEVYETIGTSTGVAIWLLVVAGIAYAGIFTRGLMTIASLVPQQCVLGISAWGAANAIWLSHYADGVERDRGFIAADQFPNIALWLAHTATIFLVYAAYRRDRV